MTGEQRKRTISRLNGANQVDAFEAAKAVWEDSDALLEPIKPDEERKNN
jgi:hypothetical protein